MSIRHSGVLAATALALSIVTSHAGPCSLEIDRMQVRVDAMIAATAAAGPSARESSAATMHRQPTPNSIATAKKGSEKAREPGARWQRWRRRGKPTARAIRAVASALSQMCSA
jgi:hypothetical protein